MPTRGGAPRRRGGRTSRPAPGRAGRSRFTPDEIAERNRQMSMQGSERFNPYSVFGDQPAHLGPAGPSVGGAQGQHWAQNLMAGGPGAQNMIALYSFLNGLNPDPLAKNEGAIADAYASLGADGGYAGGGGGGGAGGAAGVAGDPFSVMEEIARARYQAMLGAADQARDTTASDVAARQQAGVQGVDSNAASTQQALASLLADYQAQVGQQQANMAANSQTAFGAVQGLQGGEAVQGDLVRQQALQGQLGDRLAQVRQMGANDTARSAELLRSGAINQLNVGAQGALTAADAARNEARRTAADELAQMLMDVANQRLDASLAAASGGGGGGGGGYRRGGGGYGSDSGGFGTDLAQWEVDALAGSDIVDPRMFSPRVAGALAAAGNDYNQAIENVANRNLNPLGSRFVDALWRRNPNAQRRARDRRRANRDADLNELYAGANRGPRFRQRVVGG